MQQLDVKLWSTLSSVPLLLVQPKFFWEWQPTLFLVSLPKNIENSTLRAPLSLALSQTDRILSPRT